MILSWVMALAIHGEVGLQGLSIPLEPKGSYGVGYKTLVMEDPMHRHRLLLPDQKDGPERRQVLVNLWYPSPIKDGPMKHADYFTSADPYAQAFLQSIKSWRNQALYSETFPGNMNWTVHVPIPQNPLPGDPEAYQRETGVTRDASWADGKFPVVFYHSGAHGSFEENAPLLEFLAGHGYAVITVQGPGLLGDTDPSQRSFDEKWADDWLATMELKKDSHFNFSEANALGFSIGAQTGLDMALKRMDFRHLVLLDTTLETQYLFGMKPEAVQDIRDEAEHYTTPTLVLSSIVLTKSKKNGFHIYEPLKAADLALVDFGPDPHHDDFNWHGIFELAAREPFERKPFDLAVQRYQLNAKLVLAFLQDDWARLETVLQEHKHLWHWRELRRASQHLLDPKALADLLQQNPESKELRAGLQAMDKLTTDNLIKTLRDTVSSAKALEVCRAVLPDRVPHPLYCAAIAIENRDKKSAAEFLNVFKRMNKGVSRFDKSQKEDAQNLRKLLREL